MYLEHKIIISQGSLFLAFAQPTTYIHTNKLTREHPRMKRIKSVCKKSQNPYTPVQANSVLNEINMEYKKMMLYFCFSPSVQFNHILNIRAYVQTYNLLVLFESKGRQTPVEHTPYSPYAAILRYYFIIRKFNLKKIKI